MAHPNFTDRSFAQMARRALARCSYDISRELRARVIARAELADAKARLGAHPLRSRAADRRWAIHQRQRGLTAQAIAARVDLRDALVGSLELAEAV